MLLVYYKNITQCVIRPAPLVSISYTPLKNKNGQFGGTYELTLTGAILADEGSPFFSGAALLANTDAASTGAFSNNYNRPPSEIVPYGLEGEPEGGRARARLDSILHKQNMLRELFSRDGQRVEISPIDSPLLICYPELTSISFEEGTYTDICRYTINLRADTLLDQNKNVIQDGLIHPQGASGDYNLANPQNTTLIRQNETLLINKYGGFVEDYQENWSLEVDDTFGQANDTTNRHNPRSYRITRNVSATGKKRYVAPTGEGFVPTQYAAWQQAKDFVVKNILNSGQFQDYRAYPGYVPTGLIGGPVFSKDVLNIIGAYQGFNHVRTENIDKTAGTYSVTDTWLLSSGNSHENYSLNINSSLDSPYVKVSIDGNIKGLSSLSPSGSIYGGTGDNGSNYPTSPITYSSGNTPFENARVRFNEITNSGQYGLLCPVYRRANNYVGQVLNSQPLSITIGLNEFTGEISYNLEFDNRPENLISGVLSESLNINDTYPGDVFAVIPVLGRQTGPVLQYIGGRTEYKRDVTLEFVVDYTDIPYGKLRNPLLLSKPSLHDPIKTQISNLISQVSPAREPGIRKWFLSPPTENWSPKDGRYSLNLSWTYELDH